MVIRRLIFGVGLGLIPALIFVLISLYFPYSYSAVPLSIMLHLSLGFFIGNSFVTYKKLARGAIATPPLWMPSYLVFLLTVIGCFASLWPISGFLIYAENVSLLEMIVIFICILIGMLLSQNISTPERLFLFTKAPIISIIMLFALNIRIAGPILDLHYVWLMLTPNWIIIAASLAFFIYPLSKSFNSMASRNRKQKGSNKENNFSSSSNKKHQQQDNKKSSSKSSKQQKSKTIREPESDEFLADLNFFDLTKDYSAAELKAVRNAKLKENHPDKVAHMDDEIKDLAQKRTKRINDVYARLLRRL